MKILALSDLHCEFHHDKGKSFVSKLPKDVDVLVIAGDWVPFGKPYAEEVVRNFVEAFPTVISVCGNHEYYQSSPKELDICIRKIKDRLPDYYGEWHPLDKSTVEIKGIKFAGATTWFPDTPESRLFQMYMNDFSQIKDFVPWVYEENEKAIEFWETVEADIWISHHAPSSLSISYRFKGDKLNCYFVEPALGHLIGYKEPRYHIHGHMHNSFNYLINQTRVICNPYGYETYDMRSLNTEFKHSLIIEL